MLIIKNNILNFISSQDKNIIIIPGSNNAYDALPAALSVALIAKYLNKIPSIITKNKIPNDISFLPFNSIITLSSFIQQETSLIISSNSQKIAKIQHSITKNGVNIILENKNNGTIHAKDLIISYPSKTRYGIVAIGCNEEEIHAIKNDKNIRNSSMLTISNEKDFSSLCEEITYELKKKKLKIPEELATCLMTGIMIKNENFQNNVTSQSLYAASYLSYNNAKKEIIDKNLFQNKTFEFIKCWSILLKRITYIQKYNMAYTYIEEGLDVPEIHSKDIHQSIKELRKLIPFAKFIIIGIQTQKTLVCIVSIINGDAQKIKNKFNITSKNSSFSLPIKKTRSTKNEIQCLGSLITNLID